MVIMLTTLVNQTNFQQERVHILLGENINILIPFVNNFESPPFYKVTKLGTTT